MLNDHINIRTLKILLVDDSPADAELLLGHLKDAGYEVDARRVDTEAAYAEALLGECDLILSDYAMPRFSALRALRLARERRPGVPFIVVSGTIGEETAVEVMRLGAVDCLSKDRLGRLGPAVDRAVTGARLRRERKEMEATLRESEAWLRTVTETAQVGLVVVDEEHRYRYANPAYARMMGFPSSELVGCKVADMHPDLYLTRIAERLNRAFAGERVTVEAQIPMDGQERTFSVSYQLGLHETKPMVVVVVVDITEHRRIEAALRNSEGRFARAMQALMEGCQIISRDWRYLFVNDVAARQGHRTASDLLGRKLSEVYPGIEQSEMYGVLQQCMADGQPRHVENEFTEEGVARCFELVVQPVPEGLFVLSLDITERKRAEKELRERLEELQRWHAITIGREERILELKDEVNELLARLGEPRRYGEERP